MEQKKSEFNKVLNAWDVLVIAFGAMIGWGWVVSTGGWIEKGGVLGAAIGFVIGGIMIFFVGMTYAELTAAMPQCGGEHVFSYKAMGSTGSFICTWMIILGYVSVACFEACAFPTIITYLWPGFLKGYLYTVAGFDIYASWLIVAIVIAFLIMMINIIGAKTAAILQTVLTCIIGGAGILLIIASVINGTVDNLDGQMFASSSAGLNVKAIIGVAALSPFYFIGFDVIPQAAEEINVPAKKIGSILILSVVLAVVFYALVIVAVGLVMGPQAIVDSEQASPIPAYADEFEPMMLVDAIRELCTDIGIPENLTIAINNASKNGTVTKEEIESKIEPMAVDAMKSGNIAVNPRASRQCDIEMLYRRAL